MKEELSEDTFIGFNEKGEQMTFYKLLEFDSKEPKKHYLAYTDNIPDEAGNYKAYGAVVVQEGNIMKLEPIQTEKEWKVIEIALKVLQEENSGTADENK